MGFWHIIMGIYGGGTAAIVVSDLIIAATEVTTWDVVGSTVSMEAEAEVVTWDVSATQVE